MQFKTNHSPGPWALDDYDDGRLAYINTMGFNISISGTDSDILLCIAAPKMVEYLIDRAKLLHEQTEINDSQFNDGYKPRKEELKKILAILKDAGVEVIWK